MACGISSTRIRRLRLSSRLYQDLGVYGDEAEAYMETLADQFGVDMTGFTFAQYFPEEFPGRHFTTAMLLAFVSMSLRKRFLHPDHQYEPLTLEMIQTALETGRWLSTQSQSV